jgi:hypothetical protein
VFRLNEHHLVFLIWHTEYQDFREKLGDLLLGEVHNRKNLPALELFWRVEFC